jgi:leucyl aminopeptidase (aminopeptidase T)
MDANDAFRSDALQAIRDCLDVSPGESISIVFDGPRAEQAHALGQAARERGAHVVMVDHRAEIEALLADPFTSAQSPPRPLTALMANSDVLLLLTDVEWPVHLWYAVFEATDLARRNGARTAFVEKDLGEWNISKEEMAETADRVWASSRLLDGATGVHVTAPNGTDVRVSLEGRKPIHVTPIVRGGEVMAFIPYWGEVAFAPVETEGEGRIVFDGALLGTGVGPHEEGAPPAARRIRQGVRTAMTGTPVTIELRKGRAVEVSGGAEADGIRRLFEEIPGADVIAEFAYGTSPRSQPATAGRLGTAHFAFGDNLMYGGVNACAMHQNGVVQDASIQIAGTGDWILRDGRWQVPARNDARYVEDVA